LVLFGSLNVLGCIKGNHSTFDTASLTSRIAECQFLENNHSGAESFNNPDVCQAILAGA